MTKRKFPDGLKIFIIRWWSMGAVCFLVAFGTGFGASSNPLDLVFLLAAVISCVTIFLFNPAIMMLYDVKVAGRIVNNEYRKQELKQKVWRHIREIIKCHAVTILVYLTYMGINMAHVRITGCNPDDIFLPVEPILFGLFFAVYHEAFSGLSDSIVMTIRARKARA